VFPALGPCFHARATRRTTTTAPPLRGSEHGRGREGREGERARGEVEVRERAKKGKEINRGKQKRNN
jgi:hypothetical protein